MTCKWSHPCNEGFRDRLASSATFQNTFFFFLHLFPSFSLLVSILFLALVRTALTCIQMLQMSWLMTCCKCHRLHDLFALFVSMLNSLTVHVAVVSLASLTPRVTRLSAANPTATEYHHVFLKTCLVFLRSVTPTLYSHSPRMSIQEDNVRVLWVALCNKCCAIVPSRMPSPTTSIELMTMFLHVVLWSFRYLLLGPPRFMVHPCSQVSSC